MAEQFIGLQMVITLRGNPPRRLKGTISSIEAGACLTLSNVWLLDTNEWKPRLAIPAADIADISEAPSSAAPSTAAAPTTQPYAAPAIPAATHPVAQRPVKTVFKDPAIVSVGPKPTVSAPSPVRVPEPHPLPNTSEKRDPGPAAAPLVQPTSASGEATPTNVVAESFAGLKLEGGVAPAKSAEQKEDAEAPLDYGDVVGQKKKRRTRKPGNTSKVTQEDDDIVPAAAASVATAGRGKGWRQTPILQSTESFQPFKLLKRNGKTRQAVDNGWASEDVTDVQEMGEFDFEGSLAKFDKQNLFAQMRKDDQVEDAERLVSHNRLPRPKPGTAGGKNLHYSENVLDTPSTNIKPLKDRPTPKATSTDFWNSEADDGLPHGERLSGRDLAMGSRQSSRRGESKGTAGRRSQSRKAAHEMARTGSAASRVNSAVSSHHRTQSLKGSRPSSRLSSSRGATADRKKQQQQQLVTPAAQQGLYLLPSHRRVETVSALQMFNLENIAHNEIGLTEEMMTENAGRGLAEVTLAALSDPAIKVRHAGRTDLTAAAAAGAPPPPPPTIVTILAGNNKSGSRAVAAARHLRNKGVNVLVCMVGLERGERDLLEDVAVQVRLFRALGGRVLPKTDFFEHLRRLTAVPMLTVDTPRASAATAAMLAAHSPAACVTLIVDALLGLAIAFEDLRNGDQATVYELIEWANRNEAFVLAVDVPSGVDPTSGKVSVVDGNRLYVKPRYVVAVGAPKRGLLEALVAADNEDGETVRGVGTGAGTAAGAAAAAAGLNHVEVPPVPADDDAVLEWKLFLVDMGLGQAVWKKAGTKMRKGVDFGGRWVLEMRYRGISNGEEEEEELV